MRARNWSEPDAKEGQLLPFVVCCARQGTNGFAENVQLATQTNVRILHLKPQGEKDVDSVVIRVVLKSPRVLCQLNV